MSLSVIILAAGQGTRMCSNKPKVLHHLAGKSLLTHVVSIANNLNTKVSLSNLCVVRGYKGQDVKLEIERELENNLNIDTGNICWVTQKEQLGTGHAVNTAIADVKKSLDKQKTNQVLVLYGDVPLVDEQDLFALLSTTSKDELGVITLKAANPYGLGRIIRNSNNSIVDIVEEKDASSTQKLISEVNTGIFLLPYPAAERLLNDIDNNNQQKEYYLTDLVKKAKRLNIKINSVTVKDNIRYLGINNLYQLSQAERHYQLLTALKLQEMGVNIMDPQRIDIRGNLTAGSDVVIDINSVFEGNVKIGKNCIIEPNCILKSVELHDGVHIKANSIVENSIIKSNSIVGPFARIRPGTLLGEKVQIGNFVEVKKSNILDGSKINHLSYIGDCLIGKNVNIGAGTITCNYDGVNKNQTIIEDNAFIGSNSSLVAPVRVGVNSTIGAGSTISKNAPDDKLTLSRSHQKTIDDWQRNTKTDEDINKSV